MFLVAGIWHLVNKHWTDPESPTPTMRVSSRATHHFRSAQHPGAPTPAPWKLQAAKGWVSTLQPEPCTARPPPPPGALTRLLRSAAGSLCSGPRCHCPHRPGPHTRPTQGGGVTCSPPPRCPAVPRRPLPRPLPLDPHPRVLVSASSAPRLPALGLPALWNDSWQGPDREAGSGPTLCVGPGL